VSLPKASIPSAVGWDPGSAGVPSHVARRAGSSGSDAARRDRRLLHIGSRRWLAGMPIATAGLDRGLDKYHRRDSYDLMALPLSGRRTLGTVGSGCLAPHRDKPPSKWWGNAESQLAGKDPVARGSGSRRPGFGQRVWPARTSTPAASPLARRRASSPRPTCTTTPMGRILVASLPDVVEPVALEDKVVGATMVVRLRADSYIRARSPGELVAKRWDAEASIWPSSTGRSTCAFRARRLAKCHAINSVASAG
jgi:hypothetical protein